MSSQALFSGEHSTSLDPEGRILLPLGLRNVLNPTREEVTLMASLEPEGCVCVRRVEQWDAYVARLRERAGNTTRHRRLTMLLAATSAPIKLDKQGRLRIPDSIMLKVGIDRGDGERQGVVIAGHFDDLRIWGAEGWESFCAEALAAYGTDLELLECGEPSETRSLSA
jgi:division/cell wall cluster transcriptional repressor MraZ